MFLWADEMSRRSFIDRRPDAISLDLRMPKYSGYELLQTFTSLSRTQMIPVIIVSGEAGGKTKEHCKQLGAASYFEKPIDFDALRVLPQPNGQVASFAIAKRGTRAIACSAKAAGNRQPRKEVQRGCHNGECEFKRLFVRLHRRTS
jgi:CheY-like chemotaxis protein